MRTVYFYSALLLTVLLHLSVVAILVGVAYLAYLAFHGAIIIGLALVWLELWLITGLFFVRPVESGLLLLRSEEPALYALSDEMARLARAGPPDELRLTPDTSISVSETAGVPGLPLRSRRVAMIGIAALQGLSVNQFRAIIAHEMCRLRKRDTALAQVFNRAALSPAATLDALRNRTWW